MSNFTYVALDARGQQTRGTLNVAGQLEAISRLKEMGFFPTRIVELPERKGGEADSRRRPPAPAQRTLARTLQSAAASTVLGSRVAPQELVVFTRQLATLMEAGMPLLRGLRLLHEQEKGGALRTVIQSLAASIEGGSTLSEALALHPKVFNGLYVNMVKAGEIGGVLETTLKRLAEFMEKAQKIKGKIIGASFYPAAVMIVAIAIMSLLMVMVVPKFQEIFQGLLNGQPMPAFTVFVLNISTGVKNHFLLALIVLAGSLAAFKAFVRTPPGRHLFDNFKLGLPVLGAVIRKLAIARFARTLGTLASSGVPILQALSIVKETSGNVILRNAVSAVHESIKQGESIAAPLRYSKVFPAMVVGMVDIGEQTGALPEMLMKVADTYDDEVDNAVTAMTSLLEPVLIIFLAFVVGSIVIALFLPLLSIMGNIDNPGGAREE